MADLAGCGLTLHIPQSSSLSSPRQCICTREKPRSTSVKVESPELQWSSGGILIREGDWGQQVAYLMRSGSKPCRSAVDLISTATQDVAGSFARSWRRDADPCSWLQASRNWARACLCLAKSHATQWARCLGKEGGTRTRAGVDGEGEGEGVARLSEGGGERRAGEPLCPHR